MICALRVFIGLSLITGLGYPILITGMGSVMAPAFTSGSLIHRGKVVIGSEHIGQQFSSAYYFWGRPSGTLPHSYNGAASAGRNMATTNPDLLAKVREDTKRILDAHSGRIPIPVDLVTASGSGLDPHISPAAAEYQAERVAIARAMSVAEVRSLIAGATEEPTLGLLGHRRVNVLLLNLALDARGTFK